MSPNPVIDFDFALSQLSGNSALLTKMLSRFDDEYHDALVRLQNLLNAGEGTEAKQLLHTIKGVSGNLGIKALHNACRELEPEIRPTSNPDTDLSAFAWALSATLQEIKQFNQANPQSSPPQTPVNKTGCAQSDHEARRQLTFSLERNEFIPPNKLNELVTELSFSSDNKNKLITAINDLDYPQALHLLSQEQ